MFVLPSISTVNSVTMQMIFDCLLHDVVGLYSMATSNTSLRGSCPMPLPIMLVTACKACWMERRDTCLSHCLSHPKALRSVWTKNCKHDREPVALSHKLFAWTFKHSNARFLVLTKLCVSIRPFVTKLL